MTGREHAGKRVEQCEVVANERVAEGVGLMTLHAPLVASGVLPGQFVHVRISPRAAFILRRPFSVHRAHGREIEILYQVVGAGTREMSLARRGDVMDLLGPLGTGFEIAEGVAHALLVGGGLGVAPLGLLAERLAERGVAVTVALGAPTEERLVARKLFESVARRVEVSTDDGSAGTRGCVTALVDGLIAEDRPDVVCVCGPERMSEIVASQAAAAGAPCLVSLERLMACGVGACLSCVVPTRRGLRRACTDGPVFDAAEVLWDGEPDPAQVKGASS